MALYILNELPVLLTCPARSRMGISSGAILQFSLVTRVTAAPERLEHKLALTSQANPRKTVVVDYVIPGECRTPLPCSASAAHTMDILFYVSWEVIVKHMCYVMDIQPSRCQVCSDKDTNSTWKTIKRHYSLVSLIGQLTGFKVKVIAKFQFPLLEAGEFYF